MSEGAFQQTGMPGGLLFRVLRSRACVRVASYPTSARVTALSSTQRPGKTIPLRDIVMKLYHSLSVQLASAFAAGGGAAAGACFGAGLAVPDQQRRIRVLKEQSSM
jgi:hypothetical protein